MADGAYGDMQNLSAHRHDVLVNAESSTLISCTYFRVSITP